MNQEQLVPPIDQRIRLISSAPLPARRSYAYRFIYRLFAFTGGFILVVGGLVLAFFVYDASTYREDLTFTDISVSEEALSPRIGGPKNLPIAEALVDDDDCPGNTRSKNKPKLVVLGSGWGSVALLKQLNLDNYHVTVVSPVNYFLFTPMLPSGTVGTLELRSLVEPIRRIVQRVQGHFLRAEAVDVELSERLLEVAQTDASGRKSHFYLPYDKLVVGVGKLNTTSYLLGSVAHATRGDYKPSWCERASANDDELEQVAAELFDLLNEDLGRAFPKLLRNEVSVHVIQSRGHILNTYDEALSKYAENKFAHDQVEVLTNSRVKEVRPDKILFTQKDEKGETVVKELPMGFCLWSTGVSQTDFCKRIAEKLEVQTNKHALETDPHLRLNGAPLGSVYAIGDCSTVQNNVADHLVSFLRTLAYEKGKDPEKMHITFKEWRAVAQRVKKRFPQASDHLRRLDRLFEQYDRDKSGTLDFGELHELLLQIDSKLTSLPATAQRAHQQGQYLAKKLNKLAQAAPGMVANEVAYGDLDDAVYRAFEYRHLGSLAYVGNSAVFDLGGMNFSGGLLAVYLWRSVYFAQSVSFRTRVLLAMDWTKRAMFGRDLMNF
ncbi:MAG: hypothetical protein Q9167_000540 [Letrouitia subvulpina]